MKANEVCPASPVFDYGLLFIGYKLLGLNYHTVVNIVSKQKSSTHQHLHLRTPNLVQD